MKILRAIGAFFAKIGRWIANTAWVQPLLIVGGIFGIIFSIPYIKRGFENMFADSTDSDYEWYKANALDLSEGGAADKLLGYMEHNKTEDIRSEFGSKFILTLVEQNCTNCKESVSAYEYAILSGYVDGFRIYAILVDETDTDGELLANDIYDKHNDLFDELAGFYGACADDNYPLYRNLNKIGKNNVVGEYDPESGGSGLKGKSGSLSGAATSDKGLPTPTTILVDLDAEAEYKKNGVTQIVYNVAELDFSDNSNAATKAMVIRDLWNTQGLFDPNYEA